MFSILIYLSFGVVVTLLVLSNILLFSSSLFKVANKGRCAESSTSLTLLIIVFSGFEPAPLSYTNGESSSSSSD